jgi:hypothetical protein
MKTAFPAILTIFITSALIMGIIEFPMPLNREAPELKSAIKGQAKTVM